MKKILTSLLLLTAIYSFGQNEISIEITKANYKSKETKITLDISFKNNTDSLVYVISPKYYFFDKHLDQSNQLSSNGLDSPPFNLEITSNKKCKIDDEDYEQLMGDTNPSDLLKHIVEIKPNESKLFENIEINRFDGKFCSKNDYKIDVIYKPYINLFDEDFINDLKIKYELISKETNNLNKTLYYDLSSYKSIEKDNFNKLNGLFTKITKMKFLNKKTFKSNTVIATQI